MGVAARVAVARTRSLKLVAHDEAAELTLLELVQAVAEVTSDEREIVATVMHMLRSGSVRLRGNFRDEPIENF